MYIYYLFYLKLFNINLISLFLTKTKMIQGVFAAFLATLGGTFAKIAFKEGQVIGYRIIFLLLAVGCNAGQFSIFVNFMKDVGSVKATFVIKALECCFTVMNVYAFTKRICLMDIIIYYRHCLDIYYLMNLYHGIGLLEQH